MSSSRNGARTAPLFGVVIAVVALLAYGVGPGGWFASEETGALDGAVVQRGPLRISVIEKGNLESANSESLTSQLEGSATILWLIEEGTMVQPGDLLCELDTSNIEDDVLEQEIDVESARAAHENATQELEIQKSQNQSDIALAERNLEFARLDKTKYVEGDYVQDMAELDESIKLAEAQLARDQEELEWSQKLFDAKFLTRTELEADKLTVERSVIERDRAVRSKQLLETYDHPRQMAELEADILEAERELERVKLQAAARLTDQEASLSASSKKLQLEEEQLTEWRDQIVNARIEAPVAGMVVYGRERGSRWGDGDPIKEGTSVRERQEIIQIPVTEGMVAEVSLHESVVDKVAVGQTAILTFEALPGRTFQGLVKYKAQLPDKNSWWANQNLRLYRTEIEVLDSDADMRPGLTCSIEILVDDIDECVYVPVQSVFLDGGETVCFVRGEDGVETRRVETDRSNHKFVEVVQGVAPGEVVLLSTPQGVTLQPASDAPAEEFTPPPFFPDGGGTGGRTMPMGEGAPSGGRPSGSGGGGGRSGGRDG